MLSSVDVLCAAVDRYCILLILSILESYDGCYFQYWAENRERQEQVLLQCLPILYITVMRRIYVQNTPLCSFYIKREKKTLFIYSRIHILIVVFKFLQNTLKHHW